MTDEAQTQVEETTESLPKEMLPLKLDDPYAQRIYDVASSDISKIMDNITFGGDTTLSSFLGEAQQQVVALIMNQAVVPLIDSLARHHSTVQTIDQTILPVLQRDMVIHTMPDIYMLNQLLATLRRNCQVYWSSASLLEKYPAADGWNPNLVEIELLAKELQELAGIEDKEGEVPFRDIPISIVTIDGTLYERARYVNFAYTDTAKKEQTITDTPAIWLVDKQEFLTIAALGLWRYNPSSAITDMVQSDVVTDAELNKAFGNNLTATNDPLLRGMFDAKEKLVGGNKE